MNKYSYLKTVASVDTYTNSGGSKVVGTYRLTGARFETNVSVNGDINKAIQDMWETLDCHASGKNINTTAESRCQSLSLLLR